MANIDLLLREAGSGVADIVKVVVYLTDIRYREPVYRVMGRWLKGVYPVSTGLVVEALARPKWLVEIDATAVISGNAYRQLTVVDTAGRVAHFSGAHVVRAMIDAYQASAAATFKERLLAGFLGGLAAGGGGVDVRLGCCSASAADCTRTPRRPGRSMPYQHSSPMSWRPAVSP